MTDENPFELWDKDTDAPREDDQHQVRPPFIEVHSSDGPVQYQVIPSIGARMSAAVVGGQFLALIEAVDDTGTPIFTREEAFKIVLESMSAVVIHHGDDDEDD